MHQLELTVLRELMLSMEGVDCSLTHLIKAMDLEPNSGLDFLKKCDGNILLLGKKVTLKRKEVKKLAGTNQDDAALDYFLKLVSGIAKNLKNLYVKIQTNHLLELGIRIDGEGDDDSFNGL